MKIRQTQKISVVILILSIPLVVIGTMDFKTNWIAFAIGLPVLIGMVLYSFYLLGYRKKQKEADLKRKLR